MVGMIGIFLQTCLVYSLNNHLLDGLNSTDVPRALANTVFPFNCNDICIKNNN